MKKFICKVLIFSSIPIIIILFLDIFLRNQNSIYKEKYQGALNLKDSIEIIILGNSHATYGVDPTAFRLFAYNLANVNQSLYFDQRITISLMPFLKNLKYVFISIDYHSLYFSSQGMLDKWSYLGNGIKYKDNQYLLEKISPTLFAYTPKFAFSLLKKRVINRLKYGSNIINFNVEDGINLKDTIEKGYVSFEGVNESELTTEYIKIDVDWYNTLIASSNEKNEIVADLSNFIGILLSNNVTPILFTPPTYQEYNKYLNKSYIIDNTNEVKTICTKYKLKYWDFMNSEIFQRNDFHDADHLNKFGANKFGKILNDSINKIEAQTNNPLSKY